MKSCLSIVIALLIVIIFAGTTAIIWYGSSTTEIGPGEDFKPKEEAAN